MTTSTTPHLHFDERSDTAKQSMDWSAIAAVSSAFISSRLIILIVIYLSSVVIPVRQESGLLSASNDNIIVDGLVRFDSWWYHNIATEGYSLHDPTMTQQQNVAFFPVYPLLVRAVAGLTGDVFVAAIVVSNVAFAGALWFLYQLTKWEFGAETAGRAVFYFAAAPTAVFFSAMYVESVFVLAIIATFYFSRRRWWFAAAIAGALAAATRNTGIIIAAAVGLEALRVNNLAWIYQLRQSWRQLLPGLLAAALIPVGLLSYMVFLSNQFGDPLAFIHIQTAWTREVSGGGFANLITNTVTDLNATGPFLSGQLNAVVLADLGFTVVFGILTLAVLWRMRTSYAFFTLATFLVPLTTGSVQSMSRYSLMLIPCFMLLARWGRHSVVHQIIMTIFLPLMAYFAVLFSHWYFAG